MKVNEIIKQVEEGVDDPHIFKAVFMAGGPGSGKSYIATSRLLKGGGLKVSQGVSTNVITVGKFHRSFGKTSYKFRKSKGSKVVDRAN